MLEPHLNYVFPVILVFIAGFRILTAATSKKKPYVPLQPSEVAEYQYWRIGLLTLAFFSITVITLTLTLFDPTDPNFEYGLGYLSLAMFCFFISSYMFIFLRKKQNGKQGEKQYEKRITFPYIGETLEFVGIVALGVGFYYIVILVAPALISLEILYLSFLSALVGVAVYELHENRSFLHPRRHNGQEE